MVKGSKHTADTRLKMSACSRVRRHTEATKLKISLARRGNKRGGCPCVDWVPELIAAYHVGMANGWSRIVISEHLGVSVPTLAKAIHNGVFA